MPKKSQMPKKPFLSVIIPVYNESVRIKNIKKLIKYFSRQNFTSELIVVNDGSKDSTLSFLKNINQSNFFKLISYHKNRGKGYAIKKGILNASGKYRMFADIDLSTPISQLQKFIPHFKNFDVIIGSRKTAGAKLIKRQPKVRELLGKGFTSLSKTILSIDVSDFTCGFKCFSEKAAVEIFSKQRLERWGFDTEILFIAKKHKYTIKEVPVTWTHNPLTKVKFPQDLIRSFIDLGLILYNNQKNLYERKAKK